MAVMQLMSTRREARRLVSGLRKLNREYVNLLGQARGELPYRRICTCGPCLRMWAARAVVFAAGAVSGLYLLAELGVI